MPRTRRSGKTAEKVGHKKGGELRLPAFLLLKKVETASAIITVRAFPLPVWAAETLSHGHGVASCFDIGAPALCFFPPGPHPSMLTLVDIC